METTREAETTQDARGNAPAADSDVHRLKGDRDATPVHRHRHVVDRQRLVRYPERLEHARQDVPVRGELTHHRRQLACEHRKRQRPVHEQQRAAGTRAASHEPKHQPRRQQ